MAGDRSRGSVTAELAVLLPGVVLILAFLLTAGSAVVMQIRCVDAARAAARTAARGEPPAAVLAAARATAPQGSRVTVSTGAQAVTVQVRAMVALPLLGGPDLAVSGTAVAQPEQPAQRGAA